MGASADPSFWSEVRAHLSKRPDPINAFGLALPLLALYELGALFIDLQNGVDLLSILLVAVRTESPALYWVIHLAPLLGLTGVLFWLHSKKRLRLGLILPTLVESTIYAVACAFCAGWVVTKLNLAASGSKGLASMGLFAGFVMSLGAGFWEELVFRGGLMNGLDWVGTKLDAKKPRPLVSFVVATLISAFIFSGVHYIGPMGDELRLVSFVYRFVLGCLFAVIFRYRGFAVAAYTHAFFDVLVTLIQWRSS
ncbi:MAG: CPBP family intramembrane metalloprotease [Deltaproteobacteria bacterium]|nr:CPBP family intramembrane metalloprotease [Deltaproteobacteria bacterium]